MRLECESLVSDNGCTSQVTISSHGMVTIHSKRGNLATDDMQILPRFKGTMVHDFWAPYLRYPSRHAFCNAHLLRELKGISENYHQSWCEGLHALILEIKGEVDSVSGHSRSLLSHKMAIFQDRYFRILENGLNEIPIPANSDFLGKRGPKKQSKAKNLIDRCILFQRESLSFMHNFSIPFSNNQADRDSRMKEISEWLNFSRKFPGLSEVKRGRPLSAGFEGIFQRLRKMTSWFSNRLLMHFREIHSHPYALIRPAE